VSPSAQLWPDPFMFGPKRMRVLPVLHDGPEEDRRVETTPYAGQIVRKVREAGPMIGEGVDVPVVAKALGFPRRRSPVAHAVP
jgi:hypothetical protein